MKAKLIRCGICEDWNLAGQHCNSCGAVQVLVSGKRKYFDILNGKEIVRGFPLPIEHLILQDYRENINTSLAPRLKMN